MKLTKGQATKLKINQAARQLAVEKGFNGASQREIAQRAGVDKPLVQYHFPEKRDFVVSFADDLLNLQGQFAQQEGWTGRGYFEDLLIIGGMHFAYLLESEKMANITPDLVGSRANTDTLIDREANWAIEYRGSVAELDRAKWTDVVSMVMGGAYELVFRRANGKSHIEPADLIRSCIRMQVAYMGGNLSRATKLANAYDEANYDKNALFAYLDDRLFNLVRHAR